MRIADRDFALALLTVEFPERELILSFVSPEKRRRVEEEINLARRLNIRPEHYKAAVQQVLGTIGSKSGGNSPASRSYLRPVRSRPR
jgi:hypothetical protein